jgi:hypothetical protein
MKFDAAVLNYLESYEPVLEKFVPLTQPQGFNPQTRYVVKDPQFLTRLDAGIQGLATSNPALQADLQELDRNIDLNTGIIDFNKTAANRAAAQPGKVALNIASEIYNYLVGKPPNNLDVRNMMVIDTYPYSGVYTPIARPGSTSTRPARGGTASTRPAPAKKAGGSKLDWIKRAHKEILDTIGKGQPTITGR